MKNIVIVFLSCLVILMVAFGPKNVESKNVESTNIQTKNIGSDLYSFHSKEYDNKQMLISLVTFKTWSAFQAEGKRLGVDLGDGKNTTIAFTIADPKNPQICTIYMIDPDIYYLPEFTGHEFLHCAYGQWHISNNSRGY